MPGLTDVDEFDLYYVYLWLLSVFSVHFLLHDI